MAQDSLQRLCPYCFETFALNKVDFRCEDPRCALTESLKDDNQLTQYERDVSNDFNIPPARRPHYWSYDVIVAEQNRLEAAKKRADADKSVWAKIRDKVEHAKNGLGTKQANSVVQDYATCPDYHTVTHTMLCPHCHNNLPHTIVEQDNEVIAIVGSRTTGKTVFASSLLLALRDRGPRDWGIQLIPITDTTDFERDGPDELEAGRVPPSTPMRGARPALYRLQPGDESRPGTLKRPVTLAFFDVAGEIYDTLGNVESFARYVVQARGIIYLVDPFQLTAVRQSMENKAAQTGSRFTMPVSLPITESPQKTLNVLDRLFREKRIVKGQEKVAKSVAVTFTKSDEMLQAELLRSPNIPDQTIYSGDPNDYHADGFKSEVFKSVDKETRAVLGATDAGSALAQRLNTTFFPVGFFCVSALGTRPNDDMTINRNESRPHRVEDPLLWMLDTLDALHGPTK